MRECGGDANVEMDMNGPNQEPPTYHTGSLKLKEKVTVVTEVTEKLRLEWYVRRDESHLTKKVVVGIYYFLENQQLKYIEKDIPLAIKNE